MNVDVNKVAKETNSSRVPATGSRDYLELKRQLGKNWFVWIPGQSKTSFERLTA